MSDLDVLRQLQQADARLRQTEAKEVPPLYLPWSQRVLNPFPLASSGQTWGDSPQPWANIPIAFTVTALVLVTNNGTNYWTLNLQTVTSGGVASTIATVDTSAMAAGTPARLSDVTITAPASTDVWYQLVPVATNSPGVIYIFPALAILRTGN